MSDRPNTRTDIPYPTTRLETKKSFCIPCRRVVYGKEHQSCPVCATPLADVVG